jgi:hypothetical protein
MNKPSLGSTLTFAAVLAFSISAFAQHGGGRPAGAGGGTGMGASSGMAGGRAADQGMGSTGHMNMGSQAPGSVLSNSKVDSSLTNALGKSGITVPGGNLQTACSGFKNLGQCIAAMHVSKNLGLSFTSLEQKMAGGSSLGKAIETLGGPNVNAKSEAKKANKQANEDISSAQNNS